MSVASDSGAIMKILVNDSGLKTLMNIPIAEQTNYGLLVNKYFLQTYVSDKFTEDNICRILIRKGMQVDTNNDYVKWDNIIFEVFVPKVIDLMEGFQTRINQIQDSLITLFNREYVNSNKLYFCNTYEMVSGTRYFKRYLCKFEYKKIYR